MSSRWSNRIFRGGLGEVGGGRPGDQYLPAGNYLILDYTDKNKEVLIKYVKVNNKLDEYEKKIMKIKFNSDDNLP